MEYKRWYDVKIHNTVIHKLSDEYWCESNEIEVFEKWKQYQLSDLWIMVLWGLDAFHSARLVNNL